MTLIRYIKIHILNTTLVVIFGSSFLTVSTPHVLRYGPTSTVVFMAIEQ